MLGRIVVGTDGSETATSAVGQAIELAKMSGAKLDIVSAFAPISQERLRDESAEIPGDVQHGVNPREDVNVYGAGLLDAAAATEPLRPR